MIPRYHLTGSPEPRPESARTVFADGSADEGFRESVDLELSHWVPNRTPERWKADTSTEICLRFVSDPPTESYELCVNNHLDTDGVLSLWVLTHGAEAPAHAATLVGAAEMGDFSACAPLPAQRLFLGITRVMEAAEAEGWDKGRAYAEAFDRIPGLLADEGSEDPRVTEGLEVLERSIERIESSEVLVAEIAPRLTLFRYPMVSDEDRAAALRVPAFNEFPSDATFLWPQARNRFDGEKVQLVCVPEAEGGSYFDLWYPGYMWAETPHRWRAPGFESASSTNGYRYRHPPLEEAVATLRAEEPGPGRWVLAEELSPFSSLPGRGFPVVLSCLDEQDRPCPSQLEDQRVAALLEPVFGET